MHSLAVSVNRLNTSVFYLMLLSIYLVLADTVPGAVAGKEDLLLPR